jgi:tRNA pseudouridine13 synthase
MGDSNRDSSRDSGTPGDHELVESPEDHGTHSRATTYLTSDVPGIGGRLRERPEDFLVDEIPAYEPTGADKGNTGTEHIAMLVQKIGLSTMEMVEVIAKHFGVRRNDVGYAGLKDKHAITRQVVTVHVPGKKIEDFPMLEHEKIGILWADYHANKLKPGHLKGNRFSIRIRGVNFARVREAKLVLDRLRELGVPNRVGEQRFGLLENNHEIGAALVAADFDKVIALLLGPDARHPEVNAEARRLFASGDLAGAIHAFPRNARAEQAALRALIRGGSSRQAVLAIDRSMLSFYVSALQSAVFNALLDETASPAGTIATLEPGDLAFKHDNGAVFAVDEATAADPETLARLARHEISPSGPMWGGEMTRAAGLQWGSARPPPSRGWASRVEQLDDLFQHGPRGLVDGKTAPLPRAPHQPRLRGRAGRARPVCPGGL